MGQLLTPGKDTPRRPSTIGPVLHMVPAITRTPTTMIPMEVPPTRGPGTILEEIGEAVTIVRDVGIEMVRGGIPAPGITPNWIETGIEVSPWISLRVFLCFMP